MRRVDLAKRVLLTASGITRLLEGLERAGFVEKATCRRTAASAYAKLTDAGRDRVGRGRGHARLRGVDELFAEPLLGSELETLAQLLSRLPTRPARRATDCGVQLSALEVAGEPAERAVGASSSSNRPRCVIRPCSITRISSARRTVASRWAMMIDVRPRSRRSSARSIRISVGRSMFEVASSRIRMRGSASSARAIEISWRSPAERPAPPSRTGVQALVEAPRDPLDADRARDVLHLGLRRLRMGEADVVGDRAGEQERVLQHDAELPPVSAQLERRAGRGRRRGSRRRRDRRSGRPASRWSTCRRPTGRRARGSRRPGRGGRSRAAPAPRRTRT